MQSPPPLPTEVLQAVEKLLALRKEMDIATQQKQALSTEESHRTVLRQVALTLALQKRRLDIVRLMVGKEGCAFDEEKSVKAAETKPTAAKVDGNKRCTPKKPITNKRRLEAVVANENKNKSRVHLGWDPHFTADAVSVDAAKAHPILRSFIAMPDLYGLQPLPGRTTASTHGIGIRVNDRTAFTSLNALHRACFYGDLPIVKHLVEVCGMDVNMPTALISDPYRPPRHSTLYPIHFAVRSAAESGDLSVVTYLVCDRKCDKDSRMFVSTLPIIPEMCKANGVNNPSAAHAHHEALRPAYTALHMIVDSDVTIGYGDTPHFEPLPYRSRVVLFLLRVGFSGAAKTIDGLGLFAHLLFRLMRGNAALVNNLESGLRCPPLLRIALCVKKEIQSTAATLNEMLTYFPSLCEDFGAETVYFDHPTGTNRLCLPLCCASPHLFRNLRFSDEELVDIQEHLSTSPLQVLLAHGSSVDPSQVMKFFFLTTRRHCQLLIDCGFDPSAIIESPAACSNETLEPSVDGWRPSCSPAPQHIIVDFPLRKAALFQRADIINLLIDNGADPNQAHPTTNETALFEARSADVFRALAMGGAHVNWRDYRGRNVLHNLVNFSECGSHVARPKLRELLECYLFESNCDVYAPDSGRRGMTPLHAWAAREFCELIGDSCTLFFSPRSRALSTPPLNLAVRDKFGFTPMHIAALWSCSALSTMLSWEDKVHQRDANPTISTIVIDINARTTADCNSQHWGYGNDTDDTSEENQDKDYFQKNLKHVVQWSSTQEERSSQQVNRQRTAQQNPELRPPVIVSGSTALHAAATWGLCDPCWLLLRSVHCDPNVLDDRGQTALHVATRTGHAEIVRLFLKDGRVDPALKDNEGLTAKDIALARHAASLSSAKEDGDAHCIKTAAALAACFL